MLASVADSDISFAVVDLHFELSLKHLFLPQLTGL